MKLELEQKNETKRIKTKPIHTGTSLYFVKSYFLPNFSNMCVAARADVSQQSKS